MVSLFSITKDQGAEPRCQWQDQGVWKVQDNGQRLCPRPRDLGKYDDQWLSVRRHINTKYSGMRMFPCWHALGNAGRWRCTGRSHWSAQIRATRLTKKKRSGAPKLFGMSTQNGDTEPEVIGGCSPRHRLSRMELKPRHYRRSGRQVKITASNICHDIAGAWSASTSASSGPSWTEHPSCSWTSSQY